MADWIRLSRFGDVRSPRRCTAKLAHVVPLLSLSGGWLSLRAAESSRLLSLPDGKEIENAIQRSRFRYDLSVRSRLWMAGPLRRASRKSRMHPRGLEPPARRRAFPERCRRSPTAISKAFTGSCWSWRLLSVTTFRADVAPPHVGSPSVRTRVAGAAKTGGSLPAVALSSREARDTASCNMPRSVRPVFPGAALVGWCQTMNMGARIVGAAVRPARTPPTSSKAALGGGHSCHPSRAPGCLATAIPYTVGGALLFVQGHEAPHERRPGHPTARGSRRASRGPSGPPPCPRRT